MSHISPVGFVDSDTFLLAITSNFLGSYIKPCYFSKKAHLKTPKKPQKGVQNQINKLLSKTAPIITAQQNTV